MASAHPSPDAMATAIKSFLPAQSLVQVRYQYSCDNWRVDIETCGGRDHFFVDTEGWEYCKPAIDDALHRIWAAGLDLPQVQANG